MCLVNCIRVIQNQRSSKTERSASLPRHKRPYNYAAPKNGFPATSLQNSSKKMNFVASLLDVRTECLLTAYSL